MNLIAAQSRAFIGRNPIGDRDPRAAHQYLVEAIAEIDRLDGLLNTPLLLDFTAAVAREAAHQMARWGAAHDRSKSAENWFWLIGYLSGKALRAAIEGDHEKALHHCISSAAALQNWHAAILGDPNGLGLGADADLKELGQS